MPCMDESVSNTNSRRKSGLALVQWSVSAWVLQMCHITRMTTQSWRPCRLAGVGVEQSSWSSGQTCDSTWRVWGISECPGVSVAPESCVLHPPVRDLSSGHPYSLYGPGTPAPSVWIYISLIFSPNRRVSGWRSASGASVLPDCERTSECHLSRQRRNLVLNLGSGGLLHAAPTVGQQEHWSAQMAWPATQTSTTLPWFSRLSFSSSSWVSSPSALYICALLRQQHVGKKRELLHAFPHRTSDRIVNHSDMHV